MQYLLNTIEPQVLVFPASVVFTSSDVLHFKSHETVFDIVPSEVTRGHLFVNVEFSFTSEQGDWLESGTHFEVTFGNCVDYIQGILEDDDIVAYERGSAYDERVIEYIPHDLHVVYVLDVDVTNGSVSASVGGVPVQLPYSAEPGTEVVLSVVPDAHHHFVQWSDGNTENPRTVVMNSDVSLSTVCAIDTYVVSGVAVNGVVQGYGTYNWGALCTLRFIPNQHYHFTEWSDGNTQNPRTFNVTGDVVINVTGVQDQQYTLLFTTSHGSVYPSSFTGYTGDTVTVTVTPNEHYHFVEWNDGSTINPRVFVVGTESTSYSATCDEDSKYTLLFSAVNGVVDVSSFTGYTGESVTVTVTPNQDYAWDRWNDGNIQNPRTFVVGTQSTSYVGTCLDARVYHTVTFSAINGSVGATVDGIGIQSGQSVIAGKTVVFTITPNEHYHYDGVNPESVVVNADITKSYVCVLDQHVVVFGATNGSVGATVDGIGIQSGAYVDYGKTVVFTITPNSHYHYSGVNPESVVVTGDITKSYVCELDQHRVLFGCTNGSVVATVDGTAIQSGSYVDYGKYVVFTITPIEHYEYIGTNPESVLVESDIAKSYVCTRMIYITVTAVNGTPYGSGFYHYNSQVEISVTPNVHYHFTQWTDGNTQNPRTIIATEDKTYSGVNLEDTKYTLNFDAVNGSTNPAYYRGYLNDTVTVTVTPDSGYGFSQWNDGDTSNPRTFTVLGDADYVATCESLYGLLKLTSTGNTIVSLLKYGTVNNWSIQTSSNGTNWSTYSFGTEFELTDGQSLYFRGNKTDSTSLSASSHLQFNIVGDTDNDTVAVSGDLTRLLNENGGVLSLSNYGDYAFHKLFIGCDITSAPDLNPTTLTSNCYSYMFNSCTKLTSAPSLPATTLADSCYMTMFQGCTSLTTAPSLPATTLADECYYYMFRECTNLTTAPSLPATTLATDCYEGMFSNCTSLITAPSLPATTLASGCYSGMFYGCTSLTTAPSLPATIVTEGCYSQMFTGCTSLTTAPVLPATNVAKLCYRGMFHDCTNLVVPPRTLTAMDLDVNCYHQMFKGCSKLTGPIDIYSHSPYYIEQTSACSEMFEGAGTEEGAGGTIYAGSSYYASVWASEAGITTPHTTRDWNLESAYYKVSFTCTHGTVLATVDGSAITSDDYIKYGKTVIFTITPDAGYEYTGTNPESVVISGDTVKNYECTASGWTGLKFTSTGASTISFVQQGTWTGTWPIDTSLDGGSTWSEYTLGTTINLSDGQSVCFRGNKDSTAQTTSNYRKFVMTGSIAASGDVTSILNGTGGVMDLTSYGVLTLIRLFTDCTSLTTAPSLTATTLSDSCYWNMFRGCTSLTTAPSLPATTLTSYCYSNMFNGCTSLTTAPSLPSTTLADSCYDDMFDRCTSLTTAPSLPATTLASSCYNSMFYGCTSLTTAPSLPATTLASVCYNGMFYGCTSLTTAPILPATTLASNCYSSMFRECTSLTGPVNISATSPYYSGTSSACSSMFNNSGTATGAGGTIYVGGNVSDWNSTNAGIDSTYWTVQQISDGE